MIPKILHYCWFGDDEIPTSYMKNIHEWQVLHPAWEVMRWDESNVGSNNVYMKNALEHRLWANASNYTRLKKLQEYGGVYLDVDMKLIKSLEGILQYSCFLGFEDGGEEQSRFSVNNAIMGSEKGHPLIERALDYFMDEFDGTERANLSSPVLMTDLLRREYGLSRYGRQQLGGVMIFEKEIFYPLPFDKVYDISNLSSYINERTMAVHLWGRSWYSVSDLLQRIDNQDRFISEHLAYSKVLESKLTDVPAGESGKNNGINEIIIRKNFSTMVEKKLDNLNEDMASIRDQLISVNRKSASIERNLAEKNDHSGIYYAIEYLSGNLRNAEKNISDLTIATSVMEKELRSEQNKSLRKINTMAELVAKCDGENTGLKIELEAIRKFISAERTHNERALQEIKDFVKQILQGLHFTGEAGNEQKSEINNPPVEELFVQRRGDAGEVAELQLERDLALEKISELENSIQVKIEENERLNFKVTSLSTYIDNFSVVRRDLEQRILLLEELVQKMRLKNRIKRLAGLYKK